MRVAEQETIVAIRAGQRLISNRKSGIRIEVKLLK
jgi:hypothetical protein